MIQLTFIKPSSVDDPGSGKDHPSGSSPSYSLGHQGDNSTGGGNMRVLYSHNVPFAMNFEVVSLMAKEYGKVGKIRL